MFIDITPLWSWIPGWILSALNFGMTYPNGHVTPMNDLSEVWQWGAGEMRKLEAELKAATEAALKHYEGGEGSAEMKKEFDKQFTGDNSVMNVAAALDNLGDYTHDGMKGLYQDQMWSALFAGMTTYSVIALIAEFWPFGMGAASVELVLAREALAIAEREAAQLAAEEAAKAGLRNLLKPYLKKIGLQMDKWAGDSLARKAAVGGVRLGGAGLKAGAHGAMADIGIQFISDPGGDIDWGQVGTTALTWGAGGMAGRAAGLGVSKGLGKAVSSDLGQRLATSANPVARAAVSPRTMGLATGLVSGAAGAGGMYGAMVAVDPNAKFSPQMLAAGFGMGALGGARMGHAEASGPTTHSAGSSAADGHASKPAVVTPETSAEGKKLFRQVSLATHPDKYPPGAQRDAAEAITKEATQIKAQANTGERGDQYSDQQVARLRELHQQGVELAGSTATTGHGGSTSATPAESAPRTAGSGTSSTGANPTGGSETGVRPSDSGARVASSAGDGSSARPVPPERPAGQGQSQRGGSDAGSPQQSRAGVAAESPGGDTNLAAGQQDKPAASVQAGSAAQSEARVPEQRAPETADEPPRARPAEVDTHGANGQAEPRVPEQRRPDMPVDNSSARPVAAPEPGASEAESGASERGGSNAAVADSGPRPPDVPAERQPQVQHPDSADVGSAVAATESARADGTHSYAEDRPAPAQSHPAPVGGTEFRVPEQRTEPSVNSCVPEAFRYLEQAQGRLVAEGPTPQPRTLAGVPLHEVQRAIRGKFEGFGPDRTASGHAQIVEATVRAGKGASALVAEQRAQVNAGGAQGHVYTLTYNGGNHFEVNGKSAVHVETDAQGREWFVAADENGVPMPGQQPKSLAELAGGATRADAVAADAIIMRAGEVVSGLGDPNAARPSRELMMGATPEPRAQVRSLHAEYRHATTEEARARAESTRLRTQAQQAREAGLHDRAAELDDHVRRLDERADAAGAQAELLRARVVESEHLELAEKLEAVRTEIGELEQRLTDAIGDPAQIQQFRTDLGSVERGEVAAQERDRLDSAERELRERMQPIAEQLDTGRTAVRELAAEVRAAQEPSTGTALTESERGELVRATGPALARARTSIDWLQGIYAGLAQQQGELAQPHAVLTDEIAAATQARDRLAAAFEVADPQQLHPSYRGVPSPGTELVHSLRDTLDRLERAQDEAARLTERQIGLRALDELRLLPVSERVGVSPAAEPSTAFPNQRIVVVGTDTSPAGYRQALQATLRPGTDVELVLRLAQSDKLPVQVEFVRIEVTEQTATGHALASTEPAAPQRSGAWPDPSKHARPWEKTKWTEPQPPFLFKVSMVPVFDEIMSPFHDFAPGEVPEFIFAPNLPFAKTVFDVPAGVDAFQSDVGMYAFHARILSLGILDRIPNHPWVRSFVQNRPWIGKVILGLTKWLPANTAHGRSVHVPLSVDFVNKHPRIAFALGGVEQWIPSVRNGRWIQLVPMIRGTRTHAWFDDARPDPAPLHRGDLATPSFNREAQHLDGDVIRPYTGESVEIPASLAARWHANEQVRERIQEWTEGEYERYERDRVHAGDGLVHRIADQAAQHPDRYSGGDPKRWIRGKNNEWVRDPDGSLLPRHPDGSTWLRDAEGNVRPRAEIVDNLQRARDHLMRNSELNRIPDVPELWNRLIDGKPLRADVIGVEAALVEADYLATHREGTGQQAHQAAKQAGYDWDSNRPELTGDRAERSLLGKLTGRRPLSVGATTELDPSAPDPVRTRRFGTTLYYGRHFGDFGQVRGQLGDIMRGWPAAKIARAQAAVVELTHEATRSHRGDLNLARGGVHVSGRVTGEPGRQRLVVKVESDGDGRQTGVRRYTLEESDGSSQRALPAMPTGAIAAGPMARGGEARPALPEPPQRPPPSTRPTPTAELPDSPPAAGLPESRSATQPELPSAAAPPSVPGGGRSTTPTPPDWAQGATREHVPTSADVARRLVDYGREIAAAARETATTLAQVCEPLRQLGIPDPERLTPTQMTDAALQERYRRFAVADAAVNRNPTTPQEMIEYFDERDRAQQQVTEAGTLSAELGRRMPDYEQALDNEARVRQEAATAAAHDVLDVFGGDRHGDAVAVVYGNPTRVVVASPSVAPDHIVGADLRSRWAAQGIDVQFQHVAVDESGRAWVTDLTAPEAPAAQQHSSNPASTVNNCVPESLGQVNADQRTTVVGVPDPQPGNLSGRSIDEIRPHLNGAELAGFHFDAAATGHGRIAEGLIHAPAAGPGSTAWIVERRATVDAHGVGAHAYTLTYVRDNGNGTWTFTLDGVETTYHGLDGQGREWFTGPDGRRVSLPELTGGSRAEAVETWAAVWRDGQLVENVGDRTATPPQGRLRVGQTPSAESGRTPDRPTAHDPPDAPGRRSELVLRAAGETVPDAAERAEATAGSWDWLGEQLPDWPADKIDDAGLELADLVERELAHPYGEVRIVLEQAGIPGDRVLHATVGDAGFTLTESNRMPDWLAAAIEPIRHVRVHVPGELAIAVESRKIPQLARALAAFDHLSSPPEVAQDNIDHGLRHRARINRGRLHSFHTDIEGEFIECRFGDERVELTVYPLWDQDFRTGWRELARLEQHDRTVPIDELATVIVTDLHERHANWVEAQPDTLGNEVSAQWPGAAQTAASTELTDALTRTASPDPTVERVVLGEPGERRERVEVTDRSRDLPVRDEPGTPTESGRATELLDEKAGTWGFRLHSDGTRTRWFELFESDGSQPRSRPDPLVDLNLPQGAVEQRVSEARSAVVDVLTAADWPEEMRADVRLVVSELVTNVARYAPEGGARVRVWLDDGRLRVAVDDTSRGLPKRQAESEFDTFDVDALEIDLDAWESGALEMGTHGRGLGLLAEAAEVWGVDLHRDGKSVWFEVEKPSDGTPTAAVEVAEPETVAEIPDPNLFDGSQGDTDGRKVPAQRGPTPESPDTAPDPNRGETRAERPDGRVPEQFTRGDTEIAEPGVRSDAELIAAVRAGETAAYGELFERHADAARNQARRLVRSRDDADDVVSESFTSVLDVIRKGGGPDESFRAYLLTTVRNMVYSGPTHADRRLVFTDDMTHIDPGVPFVDTAVEHLEESMAAQAFDTLSERWRDALWQTEIEGRKGVEVAPSFGLSPNGFNQLSARAREALRQAYLQMHVRAATSEPCRPTVERLGAWARSGLGKRADAQVETHLDDCAACRDIATQVVEANRMLGGRGRSVPTGPAGDGSTDHRIPAQPEDDSR
ncbi:sigma-70 family RNA polymerase sigma factor [Nocardia sp. NBC_00565]|uniref:sigma-70 family RNA polymerase sigma factor n=1 Tax=Nocardia sp. NBC_00565 TaxID=2975993 RepID=UPI002E81DE6F|nr:sigma-70 family RNA polymerase sigma factor [Nocardia sp. NBC_00565]WUC02869.1 sigma-70 family RNA polymerase sigma factor [Nocardia sp. NBC_00565]